eukprot:TRINITY_DN9057_c0_g2_i3.p1 TRINITY_DN9057_c0_g2~~TRINITY_DN9057_c0_g2_i3.p1  ORF type:complete len:232 (+),score=44.53 TRINITY_DN9057_c0_g2_i3:185-880(+)
MDDIKKKRSLPEKKMISSRKKKKDIFRKKKMIPVKKNDLEKKVSRNPSTVRVKDVNDPHDPSYERKGIFEFLYKTLQHNNRKRPAMTEVVGSRIMPSNNNPVSSEITPITTGLSESPKRCIRATIKAKARPRKLGSTVFMIMVATQGLAAASNKNCKSNRKLIAIKFVENKTPKELSPEPRYPNPVASIYEFFVIFSVLLPKRLPRGEPRILETDRAIAMMRPICSSPVAS